MENMGARPTQEELNDLISAGPGLYALLTVDKKATPEEIKKRYRALAKKHHPDKAGSPDSPTAAGSSSMMVDINRAYHILSSPRLRALYDSLGLNSPNCSLYRQKQQQQGSGNRGSRGSRSNREEYYEDVYGNYQPYENGSFRDDESEDAFGEMAYSFALMFAHAAITPFKTIALMVQSEPAKTNIVIESSLNHYRNLFH
eukprot:gene3960-4585_t